MTGLLRDSQKPIFIHTKCQYKSIKKPKEIKARNIEFLYRCSARPFVIPVGERPICSPSSWPTPSANSRPSLGQVSDAVLGNKWMARNDASNYLSLGDPVGRLRVKDMSV
jgi:hypothetical protein